MILIRGFVPILTEEAGAHVGQQSAAFIWSCLCRRYYSRCAYEELFQLSHTAWFSLQHRALISHLTLKYKKPVCDPNSRINKALNLLD